MLQALSTSGSSRLAIHLAMIRTWIHILVIRTRAGGIAFAAYPQLRSERFDLTIQSMIFLRQFNDFQIDCSQLLQLAEVLGGLHDLSH